MSATAAEIADLTSTMNLHDAAQHDWDVVVVGAGPAGAMAAREMALGGASVLLVDKAAFPRPKVCGCCLNGAALHALSHVGLGDLPARLGAVPTEHFLLCTEKGRAELSLPGGVSVSRNTLDAALVHEAITCGAQFVSEVHATLSASTDHSRAIELSLGEERNIVESRVALAADGLSGGFLRGHNEFAAQVVENSRMGAGAILEKAPAFYQPGTIYMGFGEHGYVGLVRLEDQRLDVAAAFDTQSTRQHGNPAVVTSKTLREAGLPEPDGLAEASWRGTPSLTRTRRCIAHDRVFVIGDAAGYVEPFTGEGIAWALQSAQLVAPLAAAAIRGWTPDLAGRWQQQYRRSIARHQRVCRRVSGLLKRPSLALMAARALRAAPWLARPIVRSINTPISSPTISH